MFSSLFYNVRSVASWLPRMLLRRDSSSPGPGVVEGLSTSCRNNPSPEKCDLRREDVIIAIAEKSDLRREGTNIATAERSDLRREVSADIN